MKPIRTLLSQAMLMASLLVVAAPGGLAQEALPDHRYLLSRDVDFYGSDLTNLFETTQEACQRACSAQPSCVAFTYNSRSNACFPKSAIADQRPFVGAISARKIASGAQARATAVERQSDLSFLEEDNFASARQQVATNAARYAFSGETLSDLTQALNQAESSGRLQQALFWAGKAIALSDSGTLWTRWADIALRHAPTQKSGDARRLYREALMAATNGYLRADEEGARVYALQMMARALESNQRGRASIPALRLALGLQPRDDLEQALDTAIAKYGFRVTDQRIDNNAAAPRICAIFSEKLIERGQDYEPFVRIEGRGLVVAAEENQLCIDGVSHGQSYDVLFRQGLPAASGEMLHRDVRLRLYVRDRTPLVRFPGRAFVLPRSAEAALPVETVNVETLDLTLRRVSDRNLVPAIRESYFGRPLGQYEMERFASEMAQDIWQGQGTVQNDLNRTMTTRLPLAEALGDEPAGIYVLSAAVPGQDPYDNPAASQWFVLSDLGITTWSGTDGLTVALRGLSDADAREGVDLTLISRANAVLGKARTDANGFASFPAGLSRGTGSEAPALLMAEQGETDMAFLPLTDPAFDLSDRGVEGRPPAPPIDTFLATDRGAYRVGETIHATVLTRDTQAAAVTGLPITAILRRPDGVEYSRQISEGGIAGGHVLAFPLGTEVPRGAWRIDIGVDPEAEPLASETVLVEDFIPERIEIDLSLPDAPLRLTDSPPLGVEVRYLFGAPGADLGIEGEVRLRASRTREGWQGYLFGAQDAALPTRTRPLPDAMTDAQGQARLALTLPELQETPAQPLAVEVIARIAEGSGRPVERRLSREIATDLPLIGIKPLFDGALKQNSNAAFSLIGLGPDGTARPMEVSWTLNRIETRYQWYQLRGSWEWEPITRRVRVATGAATLGAMPTQIEVGTEWGRYELAVVAEGNGAMPASVTFDAGWSGGDGATDTPDALSLTLDSESYRIGDDVTATMVAEEAGVALATVLSNRIIERRIVPLQKGENSILFEVTEAWGSGAYVTLSALSGMGEAVSRNPSRALGLAHARVLPGERLLEVGIEAPEITDGQKGSLSATVTVAGIQSGETAYVTLAAVDQGILNLTGFEPPDVEGHFFGQRRLGVEIRDLYGRLIDPTNGAMGRVRSGGDAAAAAQLQSPPPTEKLMAFFAGPVTVGPDGRAMIEIDKPAFNGTIKLMAVAWTQSAVGDTAREVIARDPVVLTASLPRFLAPGDESRLLLELVHSDGPAGPVRLSAEVAGDLALSGLPPEITLEQGGTARLSLPLTAGQPGDHRITLVAETAGGRELRKELTVPVRSNDPEIAVTRQFALGSGETFTFDANLFANLASGTGSATLTAGPFARFNVPGLLQRLDRYPYGCTEQVTSSALPLLYAADMAQAAGLGSASDIEARIDAAITSVLARQSSSGAFGLWRAGSGEFWLDAYVTDFLSRARAKGHDVPDLAFRLAMDNLRNRVSYAPDFDDGGEEIAYALLVLAREGAASMGDLRYYADTKADDFATPLALAQLGAALAAYGDPTRADTLFLLAQRRLSGETADRPFWRSDFGSSLRDTAAVLKLSAEAGSTAINPVTVAALVNRDRRDLSTQEAAQVVMAAQALASPGVVPGLLLDGAPAAGPVVRHLTDREDKPVLVENVSGASMDVTLTTFGVPLVPAEAGGYGYAITRSYFDMEGRAITGPVRAGDRMVAVLEVNPFEAVGARLIVDDPLPAGLEIDNPNLIRSGDIAALDWLVTKEAEHAEFRSDRFIAAVDHVGVDPFRLAYVVRAVSPGQFHHPAAKVEDMYRPEYRALTGTGALTGLP
ncbi:MAG: alpha-2-macroglobulin family protein [Sulfitobacter sp.]|nr:alpha-2-macroglobulin family protein [Sulfitobacter sp.]